MNDKKEEKAIEVTHYRKNICPECIKQKKNSYSHTESGMQGSNGYSVDDYKCTEGHYFKIESWD